MNLLSRVYVCLWFLIAFAVGVQAQQQDVSKTAFKLTRINFEGIVSVSEEKAIESSGLKTGQTALLENLKQASQHLLDSGLFTSVKLRYKYDGNDLETTFVVVEARSSVPCRFDNFMWFSEQEISAAIRQEIPNFDGRATEGGEMIEVIKKSLEKLLRTKSSVGNIEHEMDGGAAHVFKVEGLPIPICSIKYQGVTAFSADKLTEAAKELLVSEYSRMSNRLVIRETMIPLYQQNGYLKARQLQVTATADTNPNCKNGASLLVSFNEGIPYKWNGITWAGNQVLSGEKLEHNFPLKIGGIADGLKIAKGETLVSLDYRAKGFFAVRVNTAPSFDESAQTVSYAISITEGVQYNFGQLLLKGFDEEIGKKFLERWETLRGKPYEAESLNVFMKRMIGETKLKINASKTFSLSSEPNHQDHLVNIRLEF